MYKSEFGQLGGEPYGALIADYHFSHAPTDVQLLRDLSKISSASMAPLIAGADPNLMRMDSWTELMNPRDLSKVMDTPDYAAWRGVRDAEDSRYVALCLPRVLARLPYGSKSEPIEEFAFEEETDGHTGDKYAWMNAAYAMGANINRAFKEWGWTVQIRGVESGGEVINLPTHTFPTDDGGVDLKCPTEIAITDRREAELSKAGLISIVHRKNSDKAAFIGAQSVYKPKTLSSPKPPRPTTCRRASRICLLCRASRTTSSAWCATRSAPIGRRTNSRNGSTLGSPPTWTAIPRIRARKSKRANPWPPPRSLSFPTRSGQGTIARSVFLRPHFQLEGMDIGMSLVASLPEGKA